MIARASFGLFYEHVPLKSTGSIGSGAYYVPDGSLQIVSFAAAAQTVRGKSGP